jgi:cysteine-rich repeat protein
MKRLLACVLVGGAVAGCAQPPTSLRVTLSATPGISAGAVVLTVFDRFGRVIDGATLGPTTELPGDVLVLLSATAGEARAMSRAMQSGEQMGMSVGRVPIIPGRENALGMQLSDVVLSDGDGDGVPDVIDNCPTVSNSDQASATGDTLGDACRDLPDGGGTLPGVGGNGDGGIVAGSNPQGDGGAGSDGGPVLASCGDGVVQTGEACDDGTRNSDDPSAAATCTTQCQLRAACGSISGSIAATIDPATGHCYVAWAGPINWATAQHDCQSRGGTLATITSPAENAIVASVAGPSPMWIGLEVDHSTTTTLSWVDGETAAYTNFAAGQPDDGGMSGTPEECGAFTQSGWLDDACGFPATGNLPASKTFALGYVCETGCGNGKVEPGEECDAPGATCTKSCMTVRACTEAGAVSSPVNGHCYIPIDTAITYSQALTSCPTGTHLATLGDMSESDSGLKAVSNIPDDAWIALKAPATLGLYTWQEMSAETFLSRRYHGFEGAEPNEATAPNCARESTVGWRDIQCSSDYAILCERE